MTPGAPGTTLPLAASHPMTAFELSARFFLQLAVILLVCRVVGWVGRRFLGQPQVVGEMIAGVVLGPSLFGAVLHDRGRPACSRGRA